MLRTPLSRPARHAAWTLLDKVLYKALDYDARILHPEQFSNLVADCMLYGVEVRALPPEQIRDYRDEKLNIYDLVTHTHLVEHLPRDYPMVLILEYPRHQQECYTSWRRLHAEGYKTTLCLIENVTGQQIEPGSLWAEVLYCRARNGPFASHIVARGFLETPHPMRFWQEGVQPRHWKGGAGS